MSAGRDWLATIREALRERAALWRHLEPTLHLPSVAGIDEDLLRFLGVAGIVWDVDGTLMPRHGGAVAPCLRPHFERILAMAEIRHVILSNCDEARFRQLGTIFPTVPILRAYRTARGILVRRRLGADDSWRTRDPGARVPGGLRQIRKPNPVLARIAAAELGNPGRERVLLVGDQYLTDVACANLAGFRSVKVATVGRESFPPVVRGLQRIDGVVHRLATLGGAAGDAREPSPESGMPPTARPPRSGPVP